MAKNRNVILMGSGKKQLPPNTLCKNLYRDENSDIDKELIIYW